MKRQLNDNCYLHQTFNIVGHVIHIRSSFIWSIQGPTNYVRRQWLNYLILSGSKMWHRVVINCLSDSFMVQTTACILIYLILPGPNELHDLFHYMFDYVTLISTCLHTFKRVNKSIRGTKKLKGCVRMQY